ncbi:MAG TPA: outer membrane beta-barrel protein [Saprospiraceae bacterium]|nr:outer membrane beta-barrel protein [Saprospiraceae bacterium]
MRYSLILFVLMTVFCLAAFSVQAQRFKTAVVAGLNMAQIDGDDLAGYRQPGINAGLRTSAQLSDRWQLGLELLFSQQGSDRGPDDPFLTNYDRIRFNMVEVPAMIQFSEWKIQLAAGLSYSRLINYRIRGIGGSNIASNFDIDRNNVSVLLGGTYFPSEKWGLDVRWTRAMFPLQVYSSLSGAETDQFLSYFVSFRLLFLLN